MGLGLLGDRLLEDVLGADIISVLMNAIYESCNSMLIADHTDDNQMLRQEIEKLKEENAKLDKNNDDVQTKLSNEIFQLKQKLQWCEAQSI